VSDAARIIASAGWLTLATIDTDGSPQASYLPFAPLLDGLGIVVSRLAAHATNLLERPRACALIVSDEPAQGGNYARARISIDVLARPAVPGSETAALIWTGLEHRHGEIVATLRGLKDFSPLVLEPFHARLILGFAAAYDLDGSGSLEHIRAAQHS
jgi:putative heme iron utilization protein